MSKIRNNSHRKHEAKLISSPNVLSEKSTETETPIFCLNNISPDYCLSKCQKDEKSSFADTLHKLSKLTWQQIKHSHKHGFGCEKIDGKSIRGKKPGSLPEDIVFLAFRFSGKKPMVGYKDGRVFHIVWLDRNFTLYNHG